MSFGGKRFAYRDLIPAGVDPVRLAHRWLWPLAIGLPGILLWMGYYVLKFWRAGPRTAPPPRFRDLAATSR